jgi:hypothetical protein
MALFDLTAERRYVRVAFDNREINPIRAACAAVTEKAHRQMDNIADQSLEQAASRAKEASDSEMAEGLASMFKADQEILIVCEDLALVLASPKAYEPDVPDENAAALQSVLEKIGRSCGPEK